MNREESTSRPSGPIVTGASVSSNSDAEVYGVELDRDPVEVLADEFIARHRGGERPTIDEYVRKHPDMAESIRNLFPTIAAMEQLKVRKEKDLDRAAPGGWTKIERLGDLRILGEIGRGGMGIVYLAEQESLGRQVAVKVLPKQSLLDEKRLRRFEREAKTAARLHHTNIVPILGVGEHDGYHYYVMQYIRGVGLDEIIGKFMQLDDGAAQPVTDTAERRAAGSASPRDDEVTGVARAFLQGQFHAAKLAGSTSRVSVDGSEQTNVPSASKSEVNEDSATGSRVESRPSDTAPVASGALESAAEPTAQPFAGVPDRSARFGNRYWRSVTQIGLQVADALRYAHAQGTLHRDIKPANLLLDAHGVVWVADFGLAKAMEHDNVSHTGDIVGTLRYMAPEQIHGTADGRCDIYSLGLTLYELLTLRPAHDDSQRKHSLVHGRASTEPPPPRRLNPNIPRDLETVVLKLIAEDPAERYQTAEDLAADLQCVLDDRPIQARRATPAERLWRWCRRNRAVASLSALALALLVSVAAVASVGYVRESAQRQKAEAIVEIAVDALDKIYERFAPDRSTSTTAQLTVEDAEGEEIEVPIPPVLSRETAALLEDLLPLYDRLAMQRSNDDELMEESAKANRRVGDIQQRLGQFSQAGEAYQRAIEKYEGLDTRSSDPWRHQMEIARIHNELGNVFIATRQMTNARESRLNALSILKKSISESDAPAEVRFELARTYYYLGRWARWRGGPPSRGRGGRGPDRQRTGRGGEARARDGRGSDAGSRDRGRERGRGEEGDETENHLRDAIDLLSQLHAQYPAVPEYRHLLALCYRDMSPRDRVRAELGDENNVAKATEILESLVRDFPDVADYRHDLSETYARVGMRRNRRDSEETDLVETQLRKASEIGEQLVRDNPNIPSYARTQVNVLSNLARLQTESDRYDDAEQNFRKALEIQQSMAKRFPDVNPYRFELATTQGSLADVLYERNHLAEAQTQLEESIDVLRQLVEQEQARTDRDQDGDNGFSRFSSFLRFRLGQSYSDLAKVLRESGQGDKADEAAKQAEQFPRPRRRNGRSGPPRGDGGGRRQGAPRGPRIDPPQSPQPLVEEELTRERA